MIFQNLDEIQEREIVPGYRARFIHAEGMTLAYWEVEAGAALPEHSHPHEQLGIVVEGQIEFIIGDQKRLLGSGDIYFMPGGVEHEARTLDHPVKVMDVFSPVREEYKY